MRFRLLRPAASFPLRRTYKRPSSLKLTLSASNSPTIRPSWITMIRSARLFHFAQLGRNQENCLPLVTQGQDAAMNKLRCADVHAARRLARESTSGPLLSSRAMMTFAHCRRRAQRPEDRPPRSGCHKASPFHPCFSGSLYSPSDPHGRSGCGDDSRRSGCC